MFNNHAAYVELSVGLRKPTRSNLNIVGLAAAARLVFALSRAESSNPAACQTVTGFCSAR